MGGESFNLDVLKDPRGWSHQARYALASGFAGPGDVVLDAACGIGYGATFFDVARYVGVDYDPDIDPQFGVEFIQADLTEWTPDFEFDVAISFETVEHLPQYKHFLRQLGKAKKWVIMSVPIIPTVGINPWHKHDFAPGQLAAIFLKGQRDWELFETFSQPSEVSEIYIFKRKGFSAL